MTIIYEYIYILLEGTNEENHSKNQTEQVIPFDRNRVILTPDGLRPHSTYINASFIEGYHNDESFIITIGNLALFVSFRRSFSFCRFHPFVLIVIVTIFNYAGNVSSTIPFLLSLLKQYTIFQEKRLNYYY